MDNIKKYEIKINEEKYGKMLRDALKDTIKELHEAIHINLDSTYNLILSFKKELKDKGCIYLNIIFANKHGYTMYESSNIYIDDERLIYSIFKLENEVLEDIIYLKILKESGNDIFEKVYNSEAVIYNSRSFDNYTTALINCSNFKNKEEVYLSCFSAMLNAKKMTSSDAEWILNKLKYYDYVKDDIVPSYSVIEDKLSTMIDNMTNFTIKEDLILSIIEYVRLICIVKINNIGIAPVYFNDSYIYNIVNEVNNKLMF